MSPKHRSLHVSRRCVACVSVWSWSALQFALQDLKIALANTPSVHPLFVLYCIVYYKSVCVCVCHAVCVPDQLTRRLTFGPGIVLVCLFAAPRTCVCV